MKSNSNDPSPLRQMIDVLGAAMSSNDPVQHELVKACCRNIYMAISDRTIELPSDVLPDGMNQDIMRLALSSMCAALMQIIGSQSKSPS